MELRHLRYFIAVAETLNFNRAAERLHISQPPLSRQIQQLEEELGVALFERGVRPLALTEPGRFFYAHARELLARSVELKSMTRRIGQMERSLSVGFVASTLYDILPRLIRRFRREHPEVEITLHEMTTMEQIAALKEGRIDVGFGRIRYEDPSVRRIVLRDERLMAALSVDHPLAQQQPLTLGDLLDETLILYPQAPRPSFADQVLAAFHDRGMTPEKITEVRELQVALGLVAAGEGITLVPECLHSLQRQDVVYCPLNEQALVSPIILSTRLLDESPDIRTLLAMVYEQYQGEGIAHLKPGESA
ncbi:LysR family transcriptional regulator [Pluralibacter gergoviae]|uniref:LysR family transcriptional regulator n=1 Tax=Pluralibacter gergoviae TaxID=61647 RepID=A0A0J5KHG2_PLUGE|nr:LysR family transcriptional regulator [Pluralibacter gergoviae]AVR04842.1 LysR family transcriptional regulator [Pluralibacter gergoviae]EKV0916268.1 LysR family transcriptional regulator [Pluralibacter gergoviae]EKV9906935.1 LysR family transcriptional regulator [Pluralibacter gergoviae]EKW7272642.1 LysR family transcriptional regulator [Pluralibacter gergoviae]ELC3073856.1 LysR family transcriptional regulator [Pluralibacter gergoviae]